MSIFKQHTDKSYQRDITVNILIDIEINLFCFWMRNIKVSMNYYNRIIFQFELFQALKSRSTENLYIKQIQKEKKVWTTGIKSH